jgi:Leucine-rich repeat (LRR) protein
MVSDRVLELIAAARRDRSTKLDLSRQVLTELPDSIGELDSLLELDLSNNQLTRLPDSIGNLHRLTQLYLRSNNLTELPETIGKLIKLKVLNIHENRLTKLPESIGNLTELTTLRPCRNTRHRRAIHELPLPRVIAFNSATPNSQLLQVVALFTPPSNSDSEIA